MLIKKINLWKDNEQVYLSTYVLENSDEFHTIKKRPAVIVCPGGAYLGTSDREAEPVAMRFAAQGYHAFELRYSCLLKNFKDSALLMEDGTIPEMNENTQMPQP